MAEAAHGTAPALQGKNVANPMAMILAGAALLAHAGEAGAAGGRARSARRRSRRSREGVRTADLGGHAGTSEFTDEVIRRAKLEARGLVLALGARGTSRFPEPLPRSASRTDRSAVSSRLTPSAAAYKHSRSFGLASQILRRRFSPRSSSPGAAAATTPRPAAAAGRST